MLLCQPNKAHSLLLVYCYIYQVNLIFCGNSSYEYGNEEEDDKEMGNGAFAVCQCLTSSLQSFDKPEERKGRKGQGEGRRERERRMGQSRETKVKGR